MVFGFGKKSKQADDGGAASAADQGADQAVVTSAAPDGAPADSAALRTPADPADTVYDRSVHGPFDVEEITSREGYVDLGALLVNPQDGLSLRLEVEESTQRVIAVTLDLDSSSLQLQAFAAPRSEGLWDDIREQIGVSVGSQGGTIEELDGTFGPELLAKLPAEAADGSRGFRVARFIGVDGPRWFLRGVLGGTAALDRDAAKDLEDLFRSTVVIRGENPLPPRELLVLRLPRDAAPEASGATAAAPTAAEAPAQPGRRGPEITEIG